MNESWRVVHGMLEDELNMLRTDLDRLIVAEKNITHLEVKLVSTRKRTSFNLYSVSSIDVLIQYFHSPCSKRGLYRRGIQKENDV